jgi:hypothetical protein
MLVDFLRANQDFFAWKPSDMLGIPWEVAEHSLNIRPTTKPVAQRLRHFDEEKRRAIGIVQLGARRILGADPLPSA